MYCCVKLITASSMWDASSQLLLTDALYWNCSFSEILYFSVLFARLPSCHVLLRCNGHIIGQINACHSEDLMLVNGCRQTLRLTDKAGMYSNSRARHIYTVNNSWTVYAGMSWENTFGGIITVKLSRLWHFCSKDIPVKMTYSKQKSYVLFPNKHKINVIWLSKMSSVHFVFQ